MRRCCAPAASTAASPSTRRTCAVASRSCACTPARFRSTTDVDLSTIASTTPGMVGADLRNLVNEAALLAARRGRQTVGRGEFADALEKILLGAERHILISPEERERTAYHEAGHALIGMLEPGADPVRKISIIPRGHALGVTFQSPEKDRYGFDERYLRGRMTGAARRPRGRGARLRRGDHRRRIRPRAGDCAGPPHGRPLGHVGSHRPRDRPAAPMTPAPTVSPARSSSEHTRQAVDDEVRRIADDCHQRALEMLRTHREQLDSLAQTLLEHETLDEVDAYAAAGIPHAPRHEEPPT